MLSYKMDFSSCRIVPGFGKSSYILYPNTTYSYTVSSTKNVLKNIYRLIQMTITDTYIVTNGLTIINVKQCQ